MVARQNALHDMNTEFIAGLDYDLMEPLTHRVLQNIVAILCGSHDVEPMIKSRVRG